MPRTPSSRSRKTSSYTEDGYTITDSNPYSSSSHKIETRKGFDTAASLMVEKMGGEYYVCSLMTKSAHRGKGLATKMIDYIQSEYGPVCILSENDRFWKSAGFAPSKDGYWRLRDE